MTQDEIIEMAKEVNIQDAYSRSPHLGVIAQLERFANLVAAKEREACAQIADKHTKASFMGAVGAAIRARGEQA